MYKGSPALQFSMFPMTIRVEYAHVPSLYVKPWLDNCDFLKFTVGVTVNLGDVSRSAYVSKRGLLV